MVETLALELIAYRLVSTYERLGYSKEWINQRLQAISTRKELTDEWNDNKAVLECDYQFYRYLFVCYQAPIEEKHMIKNYFKKIGWKRFLVMVLGNIFLGMGVSIFKFAGLGNDPFSGMVMALADAVGVQYANLLVILNVFIFLLELIFGRELIGAGTIVNALFLGYITTFFYNLWLRMFALPQTIGLQIVIMLIGTVVTGFGVSMYQTPNVGISPYDSLSIIMTKRIPKVSYFWNRIFTDAVCALICFLTGGIVGLGTLVSALGLGPVIDFFNVHFTRKLFHAGEDIL
jgi:uncharacterized membrane protein YczE